MPHFEFSARRIILAGGFALVLAGGPMAVAITAPAIAGAETSCPAGEEEDLYSGSCLPHTVPNSPVSNGVAASPVTEGNGGSLSSVDGVPCTGADSGKCIGLQEDSPQFVQPSTSVDGGQ
jgi:hypothetical protein